MKRIFILLMVAVMLATSVGCVTTPSSTPVGSQAAGTTAPPTEKNHTALEETWEFPEGSKLLKINYLDVGQGDSIFIALPDGTTMLIDASISSQGDKIISYIKNTGCTKLDYVVATHPHADHIGAMADVLEAFEVGTMYMPDITSNTKTFERMLDTIEKRSIKVKRAKSGVTIAENSNFSVKILAPNSDEYDDINDYSAVIRIEYGSRAFMFMGDAHVLSENEITADVSCDVVKVGHHGSRTSSGEAFVKKTGAKYAVFSLGEGNDYGHPHSESIKRWESIGAKIMRTDLLGDIIVVTDGDKMSITSNDGTLTDGVTTEAPDTSKTPDDTPSFKWVLNTNNKKIHKEGCSAVKSMSESNKEYSSKTISELISSGYSTCKLCNPAE